MRADKGQATVELALSLPIVCLVLAALFEASSLALMQVRLVHAAREAARAAVVDPDERAATATLRQSGLGHVDIRITPDARGRVQGNPLTVELKGRHRSRVPLVGAAFERIALSARATMRIEVP